MLNRAASKVNIFKGLKGKQLKELTSWLQGVTFKKGDLIFKEGARSDGLYLLCEGEVSVEKASEHGRFKLAFLTGPSFFGEASLLINVKRTATVKAQTNVKLGVLPKKLYRKKLNEGNLTAFRVSVNLARLLAERVVETNKRVAQAAVRLQ